MNLAGGMNALIVRASCAMPATECADTNQGTLVHVDALLGLVQLGALVAVALVLVFVVRARSDRRSEPHPGQRSSQRSR